MGQVLVKVPMEEIKVEATRRQDMELEQVDILNKEDILNKVEVEVALEEAVVALEAATPNKVQVDSHNKVDIPSKEGYLNKVEVEVALEVLLYKVDILPALEQEEFKAQASLLPLNNMEQDLEPKVKAEALQLLAMERTTDMAEINNDLIIS